MPDGRKKVFISWSKAQSKEVAKVLAEYLPEILEGVEIFMSDKDIDPGERSMKTIESQLDGTSYGLLVVTEENQSEPWLNFEAGALSKYVDNDDEDVPRVVPLLVDIPSPSQLTGPISQFQAVQLDQAGLERTVLAIAKLTATDPAVISKRFGRAWPEFESDLARAKVSRASSHKPERPLGDRVDEALEILRSLQRSIPSVLDQLPTFELAEVYKTDSDLSSRRRRRLAQASTTAHVGDIAARHGLLLHKAVTQGDQLISVDVIEVDKSDVSAFRLDLARSFGSKVAVKVEHADRSGEPDGDG